MAVPRSNGTGMVTSSSGNRYSTFLLVLIGLAAWCVLINFTVTSSSSSSSYWGSSSTTSTGSNSNSNHLNRDDAILEQALREGQHQESTIATDPHQRHHPDAPAQRNTQQRPRQVFADGHPTIEKGGSLRAVNNIAPKRTRARESNSVLVVDDPNNQNLPNRNALLPKHAPRNVDKPFECGLYIGESTIPNAGLGSFTGQARQPMDALGYGDVCFPNIDVLYNSDQVGEKTFPQFDPFASYVWSGETMGMSRETAGNDVVAYCPGLDCIINCHLGLLNTHKAWPVYDYGPLHRSKDAGAGANTPYFNGTTYASRAIGAFSELFKSYGNGYFESRPEVFGYDFPLLEDYPKAEFLLRNMTALDLSASVLKDLYQDVIMEFKSAFVSRTLGALPLTIQDAIIGAEQSMTALLQPKFTRSAEWLHEHGRCIDNIKPGYSTIKQAGHGAFATRPLYNDQLVTTSPLHHLPMSSFVVMYDWEGVIDIKTGLKARKKKGVKGYQILTNYCYGHSATSMLLCPYGNGINYINHSRERANIRIRWAEDFPVIHRAETVANKTPMDLMWDYKPQLAFDYIATRDIDEGEELFLDYGDKFEAAWRVHVKNWRPVPGSDKYIDSIHLNIHYPDATLRTEDEQSRSPYADYLQIRAHVVLGRKEFVKDGDYRWGVAEYGWKAKILERTKTDSEHYYTIELGVPSRKMQARIRQRNQGATRNWESDLKWIRRERVPRSAIAFFDKPGNTDMHLPNAFRHVIGVPDELIPEQWRNADDLVRMPAKQS